ncbi:peptidase S14 [Rhizobium leguminosarum]|uniref:peptidase S14 n=1 Tax=Rhizobium leguminosarum TaxID=384 RepID=UPI000FEC454D|nr:peptidase S14 [Rhizobium leguminosarum]RWX04723.1 peptidase S14 [Rhizobium leguminosarum]
MTCIASERKTGLMVADSRATSGSHHPIGAKMKIHLIEAGRYKGALLGVSSDITGVGEPLKEWVTSGKDKEALGKIEGSVDPILAMPDRSADFFDANLFLSGPLEGDFLLARGREYALGAFKAGADAFEAVKVVSRAIPSAGLLLCTCSSMRPTPSSRR